MSAVETMPPTPGVCEDIELRSSFEGSNDDRELFSLPQADGGKDAWLFLASTFIFEAITWGFPFSFGVFEPYYSSHPAFSNDTSSIAAIGTSATGIMYFAAPIVYTILKKNPSYRGPSVYIGFFIVLASLIGASFAQTVGQLIATQGVLYAVGGSIHYYPVLLYLDEWFIQRRGVAFGVICAGGGCAGVAIPFTMDWILRTYGFRTALRVWAIVFVVLTTPALFFMKPRLPVRHHTNTGTQRVEIGYLKSSVFWILQTGNIIQGLGYFLPSIYLSSFAQSVGFSAVSGTLAISLLNASQIFGSMSIGFLCDRYHVTSAILMCSLGSVVAVFVFWTFAVYQPALYIFAILYGVFAAGWATTWSGCAKTLRENGYPGTETGMVIAIFSCGKGIGAVISGPLSEALVAADHWKYKAPFAFGSGYGALIVCTGVTAACAGAGWYGKQLKLIH